MTAVGPRADLPRAGGSGALQGLKVLDFSRLLPGPFLTLLLADLGADVVKVEDPTMGGDYLRVIPPLRGEVSAVFLALNRNKRSIALELKQPEAVARISALVRTFDVVVESFKPGVLDRLGLGFETLRTANPGVILCSLSGYGQTGPLVHRAGHDIGYLGRTGALGLSGPREGPPALPGIQSADVGGALLGAMSILAAVIERQKTGQGRHLDVSLADAALCFSYPYLAARAIQGCVGDPPPRGRDLLNGGAPCYGIYATRDGKALALGALEPKFWSAFCTAAGCGDLETQGLEMGVSGDLVRERVRAIVAARTQSEWEALLGEVDACVEPVREGDEALGDPWLVSRQLLRASPDGTRELLTPLGRASQPRRVAPGLGEHTVEVLRECGVS